jgi:hypothetical protein
VGANDCLRTIEIKMLEQIGESETPPPRGYHIKRLYPDGWGVFFMNESFARPGKPGKPSVSYFDNVGADSALTLLWTTK